MHFKALPHIARISFAKGIAHAYSPSAVVAGQQGLGTLQHNFPPAKLSKTTHVHTVFQQSSGSGAGAGAKAGSTSAPSGSDGSITQLFSAWNHAQQTGDESELKKQQALRKIEWKTPDKPKLLKPADILRQPVRLSATRSPSDTVVQDGRTKDDLAVDAHANRKIDEALATEVKPIQAVQAPEETFDLDSAAASSPVQTDRSPTSAATDITSPPSTGTASPIYDFSLARSQEIVSLGREGRYADVAYRFQSMTQDGLVPDVDAYNHIIQSAIHLRNGYQAYPRAFEVYKDMTGKGVEPNEQTYQILVSFLAGESLVANSAQNEIRQHAVRYGTGQGAFLPPSIAHKTVLFESNFAIQAASKLYNIAQQSLPDFVLTDRQATILLEAYSAYRDAASVIALTTQLHASGAIPRPELYIAAIDASAQTKDLSDARFFYQQYRNAAIGVTTPEDLDTRAYLALIKTYYACGLEEEGLNFFGKVLQSLENSPDKETVMQKMTDAFVVDGLVEHYLESENLHPALQALKTHQLSDSARAKAVNKILVAAADHNQADVVTASFDVVPDTQLSTESFIAAAAMHLRAGDISAARTVWARGQRSPDVSFATMYGLSTLVTGNTEEAVSTWMAMFRQIRANSSGELRPHTSIRLDESIQLLGDTLTKGGVVYSSHVAAMLFRLMIENGGLVPSITRAAIARIGPRCVHELSAQDIALALHVQAYMLPLDTRDDIAQAARFSHLLETVLDRHIGMDPSTIHAVDNALPRLGGTRPDLEQRWFEWRSPAPSNKKVFPNQEPAAYDPYGHTTDHRASRVVSDLLDSTHGRPEVHFAESMARLRNVRRMGRHLQYTSYAKLITAAGKLRQGRIMHEILAMAQTDVPLNHAIPAVRTGWIVIYDSMVAGCLSVGERDLAGQFHQNLLDLGGAPSANTFGIYITTLSDTFDEASEAVKIFQRAISEGVTPTVFLFNAVIGKLGKARRIDDCLQYFGQMQSLGIRPSSVTYGTLVNALCRTSEESFAVEMFDEMEAAPNYRPRPAPYNSIIQYFLNTKRDRAKVLQYYERMCARNITPTSHTYKLLIEAHATLEPVNLPAAEAVIDDMKMRGIAPEAVHYGTLIHARGCVLSDMSGARKVFDSVLADPTVRVTDNLYQNLLEAMVANHQVSDTPSVLDNMRSRGIAMTPYIANTLIHGWASAGDIDKAKSVYDSLGRDQREPSTYEAMTRAFLSAQDKEGANAVVHEMLGKGYPAAVADKVLGLIGSV